jgi:hypothetical protein
MMGLHQANLVLGSTPLLGGLARRSRPPLMGARRGVAGRGPSGSGAGGGKLLGPAAWRPKGASGKPPQALSASSVPRRFWKPGLLGSWTQQSV